MDEANGIDEQYWNVKEAAESNENSKIIAAQVQEQEQAWHKQITVRGLVASVVIGSIFSIIAMKITLTIGITPHFNVSAALLAFIMIRTWTKALRKIGIASAPFTKQENTMIQTCSVACYSIALGGGFASYLLAMNKKTFELSGGSIVVGNSPSSIKEPGIGWMTAFLFLVCFVGLFVLIPLRKWFYTAKDNCGFSQFPTFGLQAKKQTFYFDFSMTYVGTGMICSHAVNLSLLLGAVLSYGMMWPLIVRRKGDWFPADIPETSMKSLTGYKVPSLFSLFN
ncbi:YELLOW STRIPE like 3 [Perilla frutescens var. frutescens]|nr:YELLOW STRIPE like 3 [Perilla frutescens var. frutescens]